MPKQRMDLFFEEEAAEWLRDMAEKHGLRIAGVIERLWKIYGEDLDRLLAEQAEMEAQRVARR